MMMDDGWGKRRLEQGDVDFPLARIRDTSATGQQVAHRGANCARPRKGG